MFKNKLFSIALIILIAITLLGASAFFAWEYLHPKSADAKVEQKKSIDEVLKLTVDTKEMTTNLYSGGYVKVQFKIQTDSDSAKKELEKRDFQVENIILKTIGAMTADEVHGPEGMKKMEAKIKNEINKILSDGQVVDVITTRLIVQ